MWKLCSAPLTYCYVMLLMFGEAVECLGVGWMIQGLIPGRGKRFSAPKACLDCLRPIQPPVQWVEGVLYAEVKCAGCEPTRLHPSSAKVKNRWSYTSFPPICIHGMPRDYCTFICSFTCLHSRDQNDPGTVYSGIAIYRFWRGRRKQTMNAEKRSIQIRGAFKF